MSTTGWGRGGWGSGSWGTGVFETISLTGVSATGVLGDVAAILAVYPTSVEATVTLGSLTVTGAANLSLTSLSAAAELGIVSVTAEATASLTGLYAQGMVGSILIWQVVPVGPPSGDWVPVAAGPSAGWVDVVT